METFSLFSRKVFNGVVMTSLKDISTICQVSVTTVSKALNGRRDVGKKTREKILRTARELHYTPREGKEAEKESHTCSMNLGVLMPTMQQASGEPGQLEFFLETHPKEAVILEAFCETAMMEGFDITLLNVDDTAQIPMSYLARCRYRRLDGVFIFLKGEDICEKEVMELLQDDLPVVTLQQMEDYKEVAKGDAIVLGKLAARNLVSAAMRERQAVDFAPQKQDVNV